MIRRSRRKHSLIWKITVSYLLLTAVPIFVSYVFISVYWWNTAKDTSIEQSRKILQYSKYMMEAQLLQMEKLTGSIFSNTELLGMLDAAGEGLTQERRVLIGQQFDTLFFQMSYSRPDLFKYYFYDALGNLIYFNGLQVAMPGFWQYNPQFEDWFEHTRLADGKSVFISTKLPFQDKSQTVFSISRLIKSKTNAVGVVLIDFNFSVLQEMAARSSQDNNSELIIADFDGSIIHQNTRLLAPDQPLVPEIRLPANSTLAGSETVRIGGASYLMIYDTLEKYTIKLIHLIPVSSVVSENMHVMLSLSVAVFLFMLLMLAVTIYYFTRRIRPLNRLAATMQHKIEQPFTHRVPVTTRDEIGTLEASFNDMMERLQELFERDYKHRLEKAEAQKALLEAQINPHFLYNTLDTIRFKALERGNEEVSNMIFALSVNLRYTIANTDKQVTVKEEVEWLERYMYLQKLRFKNRFETFFQIDISIHREKIYRLILQPFIENAILHGFKNTKSGGILHINGYRDPESRRLCFDIVDNGSGFDYEIHERVGPETVASRSRERIGMHNALHRLFLYYRDDCEVLIDSIPGVRTAIQIRIQPTREELDDAHPDH